MKTKTGFLIVLIVVAGLVLRSLFPRVETVTKLVTRRSPPVRDTASIDSLKRVIAGLQSRINQGPQKPDTIWLERVTFSTPDTVYRVPEVFGLTGLLVGKNVGDSTLGIGFHVFPLDTGYVIGDWSADWITGGPLRSFSFRSDGTPMLGFYDPPKAVKSCGFLCKASHYLVGGAGGYAACRVGL